MNEDKEIIQEPASEATVDTGAVSSEQSREPERQVPLQALEAERHKRQEVEAQNRILQDYASRYQQLQEQASKQQANQSSEDDHDLVNKKDLKQFTREELAAFKREVAEDTFKEVNPEAIKQINMHLKEILERKPWLANSIEEASNRYSRAYEIVQDYAPAIAAKKANVNEAQRIVDNAKKPGSPVSIAKSAGGTNADYLKSIGGKAEFREYRKKMLQG